MATPEQIHRQGVLMRDGAHCLFDNEDCQGRLEAHHVVSRQRLRTARAQAKSNLLMKRKISDGRRLLAKTPLEDLLADARNGVMMCGLHHSRLPEIIFPQHVQAFCAEYDLTPS